MTLEEIRVKCGLAPFVLGKGKTTYQCCVAIADATELKSTLIVAHSKQRCDHVMGILRTLIKECELNCNCVILSNGIHFRGPMEGGRITVTTVR